MRKIRFKLRFLSLCLFMFSCVFIFVAANKLDIQHYDPEAPQSHHTIYVNHDGYNFIIASNYFTGYCVLGGACLVCSSIFYTALLMLDIKEKHSIHEEHPEQS